MGRTFKSVRMGSQEVAARWLKASRALNKDDQIYGQRLAEILWLSPQHDKTAYPDSAGQ